MSDDRDMNESLRRGIEQAEQGEVVSLGNFTSWDEVPDYERLRLAADALHRYAFEGDPNEINFSAIMAELRRIASIHERWEMALNHIDGHGCDEDSRIAGEALAPHCICGALLPLYDPRNPEDFVGHWCEALDEGV